MLQCLIYCSFDIEPRKFIFNLFESWDSYVRSKYNTISDRYQGAEKNDFYYRIHLFILLYSCKFSCNTEHVSIVCLHFLPFISFPILIYLTFIKKKHWLSFAQIIDTTCVPLLAALVSLCTIGMIKDNWDLTSSWCWIGYLTNLFHGSRIMLKNGSVLGTNI